MLEELVSQAFWIGLLKIIGVNIILSGDNAVVIALAARSLPAKQQTQAVFWGAGAAVILRILLTIFAVALLLASPMTSRLFYGPLRLAVHACLDLCGVPRAGSPL